MILSEPQKKHLRGLGHRLKPVITVSDAGLTAAVLKEFESSIAHHELIKVRVRSGGREARDALIEDLCRRSAGQLIQRIGNVALIYRRNSEEPRLKLPSSSTRSGPR